MSITSLNFSDSYDSPELSYKKKKKYRKSKLLSRKSTLLDDITFLLNNYPSIPPLK